MSKGYVAKHNDERHVQNERAILTRLRHPFVVSLFGTFQDKKKVYFVMEFVAGGELFSKLRGNQCLTAPVARFYLAEILSALAYVHANGFAYRDLRVRPRPPFLHVGESPPPFYTHVSTAELLGHILLGKNCRPAAKVDLSGSTCYLSTRQRIERSIGGLHL